jgi:hypothetical protein
MKKFPEGRNYLSREKQYQGNGCSYSGCSFYFRNPLIIKERRRERMKRLFIILFVLLAVAGTLCLLGNANLIEERQDLRSIVDVLRTNKIEYYIFQNSQQNQFLVVPKFGARILQVSVGGENLFWTNPDILKGQGGQRSWVSPEGGAKGFLFKPDWNGTRDFSMLDPGNYKVLSSKDNEELVLVNTFRTTSNDGKETYYLTLTREIRLEGDPLKEDPDFRELHYQYLGIDFIHRLKNNSRTLLDKILGLWCLIQVPPKGTMVVPVSDVTREAWRATYFEPIPDEFVKANPDSFSFFIHGSQCYKVGIRSQSAQGAIGYICKAQSGGYSLVLMTFPVKPEGSYPDKPKAEQETNGDAIQLYSHLEEGTLAFGELECQSWGLDLPAGGEGAFPIKVYLYRAPLEMIKKIGKKLVCPQFDKAYLF